MKKRSLSMVVLSLALVAAVGATLAAQDDDVKKKPDPPEKKKAEAAEKKKIEAPAKIKKDAPDKIKKVEKEEIRIVHPDGELKTIFRSGENQAWLGAMLATVSEDDAQRLSLQEEKGALVKQVLPKSPAESAGLMADDVIIEIEHKAVGKPEDAVSLLGGRKPDEKVTIVVRRDKQLKHLTVTLGKRPAMMTAVGAAKAPTLFKGAESLRVMAGKSITCPHCKRSTTVHSFGPMVMKSCPKCERMGMPGYKYCPYDGTELPGGGDSEAKFCPFCGKGLGK